MPVEFGWDVDEAEELDTTTEAVDAGFEQELDGTYESYLSGMSKEELLQLRESLLEYADGSGDTDEDDEPWQKTLKLTRHR